MISVLTLIFVVGEVYLSSSCVHLFLLIGFEGRPVVESRQVPCLCDIIVALVAKGVVHVLQLLVLEFYDVVSDR